MTSQTDVLSLAQTTKLSPGTPAIVDVFAEPTATGVSFSHEWRWHGGPKEATSTISVPPRGETESGTPIHFDLHDKTGRGFCFTDDAHGPIWVKRGGCPVSKWSDTEIPGDKMERAPKLLKVFDENGEQCTLTTDCASRTGTGRSNRMIRPSRMEKDLKPTR